MSKFDFLLVAHFIGDYLFQTNWMAVRKMTEWVPLFVHSLVYTLIIWGISILGFQGLSWQACAFILVFHFILDRRTFVNWWSKNIMGLKCDSSWLTTMVDQSFHLIILALALFI